MKDIFLFHTRHKAFLILYNHHIRNLLHHMRSNNRYHNENPGNLLIHHR